jgi:hypothetical protein
MKAVAAFYNALSNADGVSAAALVIPEKRTAFGVIEMTTGCGNAQ